MINKFAIGIFAVFLVCSFASAVSVDMKESYGGRETIITEITGNFVESLNKEQIEFRRGHVAIALEYGLEKLQGKYFLWAIAPESENNYTLAINDIVTTISGKTSEIDFEQNFTVSGNISEYTISPGAIFARDDFDIKIDLNRDIDKTIEISFPYRYGFTLKPGENKLKFSLDEVYTQFVMIEVGQYSVPAYIIGREGSMNNETKDILFGLRFNPREIESTIFIGGNVRNYPFQIINGLNEKREFDLEFNEDLFFLEPDEREGIVLDAGESKNFAFTLKEIPGQNLSEGMVIRSGNFSAIMPIKVFITENGEDAGTPYLDENLTETAFYKCTELGGSLCNQEGQVCDGILNASRDGNCCIGTCINSGDSEPGNYSWIGYVLGGVIIIGLIYVVIRYKKTKSGNEEIKNRFDSAENAAISRKGP